MIDRSGQRRRSRTATLGASIAMLLASILGTSGTCTPVRAADTAGTRGKLVGGSDASPRNSSPVLLQPLCSGDAGALLYPLDASTFGDWTPAVPPACDDCTSASIPLGFTFDLYGDTYGAVFVNNNGNISFGAALEPFFPTGFPDNRFVNVAPFYADGDTRENPDPSVPSDVYQRWVDGNGDGVQDTFVATWRNLGYYERSFDRRNTFQVAISDGTNLAMGLGNNVCFSYDAMCWTTGNFDGGVGGFGQTPAVVGVNRGDGVHSFYIGRFNQDGSAYDGPDGDPGGVHFLDQRRFCFSTATTTGNVCPIALDADAGARVVLAPGQSYSRTLRFVSPEGGQTTNLTIDDPDNVRGAGLSVTSTAGNPATVDLRWTPTCASLGTYALVVHATDDATTPCTTNAPTGIVVSCDDGDPCTGDACDPGLGCTHDRKNCDDGNLCTDDSCDPAGGCIHVANSAPCDDGQSCTANDHCRDGECVGQGSGSCDDGNPCTDDSCNPSGGGCRHTANRASCDDGNPCTTRDRCSDRHCVGTRPASCDDGDSCTRDSCDPARGCVHVRSDEDGDGVCDRRDACDGSILTPTVVVGTCDSHVPNTFFPFGCSISDFLGFCEERRGCARSNAARCVDQTLDLLRHFGIINRAQERAIERCYQQRG